MIPIIFLTFLMIWSPSNASSSSEVCAVTEERLSELLYEDENMRLDDPRVRRQKKETAEIERRILNRLTPPVATFEKFYNSMRQSLDKPHKCGMRNNTSHADCTHYIGIQTRFTRAQVEASQFSDGEYEDEYDYMQPCFSRNPTDPDDNTYYWYVFFTTLFNHTHTPQSYDHHKQWGMLLRR